jgi:hypothetical protein
MKKQPGPAASRRRATGHAERRKRAKKDERPILGLPVLCADTAGIDIGATEIYVAVPADRDEEPVRCFDSFTEDLHKIAEWLRQCGVAKVAMESTGVYWIPLWQILADAGFEMCLVNARYFKNVPGKKTDVEDCQWLQFLHSVGLLRGSYRPAQAICGVRTLLRYRTELIRFAAEHIQHMQKALEQMNVKLSHVISDRAGDCRRDSERRAGSEEAGRPAECAGACQRGDDHEIARRRLPAGASDHTAAFARPVPALSGENRRTG